MAQIEPVTTPILTPTFSAILNSNLLMLTERLNNGRLFDSFEIIKTVIDMLKEEDRKPLFENDVAHIHAEINLKLKIKGVDLYQTRRAQRLAIRLVLNRTIRPLFRKLMSTLHKGHYLEKARVGPRKPTKTHLDWE